MRCCFIHNLALSALLAVGVYASQLPRVGDAVPARPNQAQPKQESAKAPSPKPSQDANAAKDLPPPLARPGQTQGADAPSFHFPGSRKAGDLTLQRNPFTPLRRATRRNNNEVIAEIQRGVKSVVVDREGVSHVRIGTVRFHEGDEYAYKKMVPVRNPKTGYRDVEVPGKLKLKEIAMDRLAFEDDDGFEVVVPLVAKNTAGRRVAGAVQITDSGILVHPKGLVLAHVPDNYRQVVVNTLYGRFEASVMQRDAASGIALLQIKGAPRSGFPAVQVRKEQVERGGEGIALVYQPASNDAEGAVRAGKVKLGETDGAGVMHLNGYSPAGVAIVDMDGRLVAMTFDYDESSNGVVAATAKQFKQLVALISNEPNFTPRGTAREVMVGIGSVSSGR